MEKTRYVIALDQGTTSSRAMLFDHDIQVIASAQRELTQYYPQPGWVEQDPMEIWASQSSVLTEVLAKANIHNQQIAAIGISNQRETVVIWDKETGKPVYNAIVWQCRRTTALCDALKAQGHEPMVRDRTGLRLDPYFSASKLRWILDQIPGAQARAEQGQLLCGTIDCWLLWKMTQGEMHATDPTNACRTLLFNIHTQSWDPQLLQLFGIPAAMLPEVRPSSGIFGHTRRGGGADIPIAGMAGDQQAALFGQLGFEPGIAKNTYGTGCFLLMNTGTTPIHSRHGLLTTLAIGPQGSIHYALEGAIFMGGATIQWLRDELRLIDDARDSGYFASKVEDTGGVYLVPAFVGLGAPYWAPHARGMLVGLTRGTNRNHLIRAALEAIAYQSRDVLDAMQQDAGITLHHLRVDGGAVANDFLLQFQADIMGTPVIRPRQIESSALGAAFLAGLAVGFWVSTDELAKKFGVDKEFNPQLSAQQRQVLYQGWQVAIQCARQWPEPESTTE